MLKSKSMKTALLAFLLIFGLTNGSMVIAAENGALNYPAGSPGIFIGEFPPIPGLFVISQTSYTTSDALYDQDGDKIDAEDFEMDAWVETFRFLASYPVKLWGANLYSQLVIPVVKINTSLSLDTPGGTVPLFDDDDTGLGNITISPVVLNWHDRNSYHYYTAGIDFALAQGASYDEDNYVNAGTGYTSIIPTVAYRYDDPDGLDVGVKASLMFNLENDDTNYDSGDMLAVDFMAGWNFGKWKAGIVGGFTDQWESDELDGDTVNNSDLRSLNLGPSVAYAMGPIMINVNYQKGVLAENTSKNDSFWLNITLPLYVPSPPMMK